MWACTSLFIRVCVEHGLKSSFLLLAFSLFLYLSPPLACCRHHSSSDCNMFLQALWEEISPPMLCVCVVTVLSCSTQLSGHRQLRERSTNCSGHWGYTASLSLSTLSASASISVMWFTHCSPLSYCIITHDITVYIAMTNKYWTLMFETGNLKCSAVVEVSFLLR